MTDAAPHPTPRPGGPIVLLLQILAGLIVALAGLSAVIVLPFVLLATAMGDDGGHGPAWPIYIWVPLVFLASIYTVISGLRQMDDPRLGRIAILFGIATIAFFSFPPFWLSGS